MSATVTGVFNLIDRASGPLRKIEEQARKTDAALATLGDRMDNVGTNKQMKQFQDVGKSLKDIERQTKGNNSSMSTMDRHTKTLGNSTDKLNTKLVRTGLKLKALHMIMTSFKFPVMVAGVGAVAQAVAALGAGLTAMLPQIGQWAGSMVSLLPNLVRVSSLSAAAIPSVLGLGSAFLGAKLAFSGFSDAVSQGGAALSKLEPQARRVALTLRGVGKELKENLQATAQSSFFNMLSADRLKKTVFNQNTQQKATKIVGVGATTAGATADNVLTGLTRGGFLGDFLKIARQMQPVIVQLSSSFLNLAHAAMDIGVAALPMTKWLGETINGWTQWAKVTAQAGRSTGELGRKFDTAMLVADQFGRILTSVWDVLRDVVAASDVAGNSMWDSAEKGVKNWSKWTSSFEGKHSMADWFTHASESASTLWSIVKNVSRGLFAMGGVSRETGDTLWQSLDRVTDKWADWMNSMTGQNEMATYFKNVREPLQVAGSLVAGLVGGFVELGKSRTVTETLKVLTEGIGPLTESLDKLGTAFGPVLANSVVQILKLFTNLQSEGGAFARVIEMFNTLLEGINAVLDKFSLLSTAFSVGIFGLAMTKATGYITRMASAWGLVAQSAGAATVAASTASVVAAGGRVMGSPAAAGAAGAVLIPRGARPVRTGVAGLATTGATAQTGITKGTMAGPVTKSGPLAALSSKVTALGGAAATAKVAGAAIGKFVWPVMALMAASDFISTSGGFDKKLHGMFSGATLGLVPGPVSSDELTAQGQSAANASTQAIWRSTGANSDPTLGNLREAQAKIRARMLAQAQEQANPDTTIWEDISNMANLSTPMTKDPTSYEDFDRKSAEGKALIRNAKQTRLAMGQASLQKGQSTFDDQQAAFSVYRRKLGLVEGSSEMAEQIVRSLSQEKLGKKGAKALAQSQLTMFRQMAKQNPKLQGVYEDLSHGIEKRLGKMNSNVQIINGKIYDGGAKEWGRLKRRIGSEVEEARQMNSKAFTAIQKQVKSALIIRGFSERQANAMINRNDGKGHGPMSHSADPAPTPGGLSRGSSLGDHRTPEEKAAAAIRIGRRQAADAVPVTGGRSKSIQAFKDEEKQLDHYKKKYAGLKVDLTDANGKIYRNTTDMFNQTANKVDKAMQRQKESVNTAYASIVQQTKQKLAAIGVTGSDAQSILSSVGLSGGGGGGTPHGGGGHNGATGMRVNYAGGGRIGGTGNQDKVGVGPGHMAAPGELIVNRHTEADVNRDLISHGKAPLGRRVAGENRPHYMPESHAMGGRITFGTGGRAGQMGTYPGVTGDTDFVPGLGQALSRLSRATGTPITVNSGWRSYSEQAALYASYLAGTGNLAAPPGSSNHEDGMAADISPGSEVFGSMASRFGLGFTVPGESWHIELVDGAAGGPPGGISMGGGGGAAAPKRIRLKAPKVGGHGMTGVMGQLSANMMTGGMNKRINKKLAAMGGGGGVVAGGGGGGSVPAQIYSVLSANGWNKIGAAGVIGNAYAESSFNPAATGYGGGGLWGFTASPNSLADLQAYAQGKGSWTDAALQTRFLLEHVAASTKAHSNTAGSPEAAASVFMNEFERPGIPREDVRQQAARRAFEQGYATGGRVPQFGGWFGDGGSFMAHRPTMIGVGENGSEHVQITPKGKGTSGKVGGTNVTIQAIHIENHRSGDVKKAVKKEIEAAFTELERELHNNTGSGMV